MEADRLENYIGGVWTRSSGSDSLDIKNPATAETLARVPMSTPGDVDAAALAAASAFDRWGRVPVVDRVQYLFKLKNLLEEQFEDLARTITMECGKTLSESRGELRRGIENIEVACGMPSLIQGSINEAIAVGIDEFVIRQPLGVSAMICPFNFPAMIVFWFLPYALAAGNTCIVKPSERVPLTMNKIFHLIEQTGLPKGVVNLVHGSKLTVDAILDHPTIRSISFVGSTQVAKYIYRRAAEQGKRAQCQGGAKNAVIILPDADLDLAIPSIAESAFGCAGQRCLAASLAITVGDARKTFTEAIGEAALARQVGYGLDMGVEMGPVITPESKTRIEAAVDSDKGLGARILIDGRQPVISGYEAGNFVKPTILSDIPEASQFLKTELFGPVLGLLHVDTVEQAIDLLNRGRYGNMACLYTRSGSSARRFRHEAQAGNIGINVGVAAPMAFFPFSGWKDSFFGDLHGQSRDAVEFFTQKKVVIERWS